MQLTGAAPGMLPLIVRIVPAGTFVPVKPAFAKSQRSVSVGDGGGPVTSVMLSLPIYPVTSDGSSKSTCTHVAPPVFGITAELTLRITNVAPKGAVPTWTPKPLFTAEPRILAPLVDFTEPRLPGAGNDGGGGVSVMLIVNTFGADACPAVTVNDGVLVAATVGKPVRRPAVDRTIPGGNVVDVHAGVPVPPVYVNCVAGYAVFTTPFGSDVVLITGAVGGGGVPQVLRPTVVPPVPVPVGVFVAHEQRSAAGPPTYVTVLGFALFEIVHPVHALASSVATLFCTVIFCDGVF